MKYNDFRTLFEKKDFISLQEILLREPKFDRKQLSRWVKSGKIQHIARSWYTLSTQYDEEWRMMFANAVVPASYISSEFALSFYSLIPEEAILITSVTTDKTHTRYLGKYGNYRYQSIIHRAFLGYTILPNTQIRMATAEKALIDFLYYHPDYISIDDFDGMRLIREIAQERMTPETLRSLAEVFQNSRIKKQIEVAIHYIWEDSPHS